MKRTRAETMQNLKPQEETNSKSQRRYRAPKCQQTVPKIKAEEISQTTTDVTADVTGDPPCSASPGEFHEDPLYVLGDELSFVWPWAVEQEVLSGWYPFVDGHFREVAEEGGIDLHDLWRLNEICEVPN